MVAKQLSIFLENKSGRLTEVTEVLAKENINLSALCIAENADFGIWGSIAEQLGKKEFFKDYYSPLKAPEDQSSCSLLPQGRQRFCSPSWEL